MSVVFLGQSLVVTLMVRLAVSKAIPQISARWLGFRVEVDPLAVFKGYRFYKPDESSHNRTQLGQENVE